MLNRFSTLLRRSVARSKVSNQQVTSGLLYAVTPHAAAIDLASLKVIEWTPAWMTHAERLCLYTLIFTLRPKRYLEIGTFQGGSALIVAAAMNALDYAGRMVCVDPKPQITPEHWQQIEARATLLAGYSPQILPQAMAAAGGLFDFVLIDGDHTAAGVIRDANGVLPFVGVGAYLLFHDCFSSEVGQGIDRFVKQHAQRLVDLGPLTREYTVEQTESGQALQWGGLRMVQVRKV